MTSAVMVIRTAVAVNFVTNYVLWKHGKVIQKTDPLHTARMPLQNK